MYPRKGTLKTWDDDRGFGFIRPADGGPDLFVHISAFPSNAPRPSPGDQLLYEAGQGKDGRPRASRIYYEAPVEEQLQLAPRPQRRPTPAPQHLTRTRPAFPAKQHQRSTSLPGIGLLLFLGAGGLFVFSDSGLRSDLLGWLSSLTRGGPTAPEERRPFMGSEPSEAFESRFSCDGRTRCTEMSSCAEAMFFIENCPGTKMDGDGDGVPCESQWCGGY